MYINKKSLYNIVVTTFIRKGINLMKKIAFLGCENSHTKNFLKAMAESPEQYADIEVIGVYSYDNAAMQTLHDEFGVKMLEDFSSAKDEADGVIITTRDGKDHYRYAEPYLNKPITMFMDKPVTVSEEDALKLARGARCGGVKICGGSMLKFDSFLQALKADVKEEVGGKTLGGYVRAPIAMESQYSGLYFYAQHLVDMVTETFGLDINAVYAKDHGASVYVNFYYDGFSVEGHYTKDNYKVYYVMRAAEEQNRGGALVDTDRSKKEFDDFCRILRGGEQTMTYEELIVPAFILNAIDRSLKSGKEEAVNKFTI